MLLRARKPAGVALGSFSLAVCCLAGVSPMAAGQSVSWDRGAGTALWSDANNWSPNGVPGPAASLTFNNAVATGVQTIDLGESVRAVSNMSFNCAHASFSYTFENGAFQLHNDATWRQMGLGRTTINSPVDLVRAADGLAGTLSFELNGPDVVFGGPIRDGTLRLSGSSVVSATRFDAPLVQTRLIVDDGVNQNPSLIGGRLMLNASGLSYLGNASGSSVATLTELALSGGNRVDTGGPAGTQLILGGLSRSAGAAVNLSGNVRIDSGLTERAGIADAWVTYDDADWASMNDGRVSRYTGYATSTIDASGANDNVLVAGSQTSAGRTINTLKIEPGSANQSLTLNGALVLNAGGLLYGTPLNYAIKGPGKISADGELVAQVSAGELDVQAGFAPDVSQLTKAGGGALRLSAKGALPDSAVLNLSGGSVVLAADQAIGGLGGSGGALQLAGANLTLNGAGTYENAKITGQGALIKRGGGEQQLIVGRGGAIAFDGGTQILGGTLRWTHGLRGGSEIHDRLGADAVTIDGGRLWLEAAGPADETTWVFENNLSIGAGGGTLELTASAGSAPAIGVSSSGEIALGGDLRIVAGAPGARGSAEAGVATFNGGAVTLSGGDRALSFENRGDGPVRFDKAIRSEVPGRGLTISSMSTQNQPLLIGGDSASDPASVSGGIRLVMPSAGPAGPVVFTSPSAMGPAGLRRVNIGKGVYGGLRMAAADIPAALARIDSNSRGILGLEPTAAANLQIDLSASGIGADVRLGSGNANATITSLTPFGDTYRFGGGGGRLAVTATLANGATPRGVDVGTDGQAYGGATTVILDQANTYTGATVVRDGMVLATSRNSDTPTAGPFGDTSSIELQTGTLRVFHGGLNVNLDDVPQIRYSQLGCIQLDRVTASGQVWLKANSLTRVDRGVLLFNDVNNQVAAGEKLLAWTAPAVKNGMVMPHMIRLDQGGELGFLTYSSTSGLGNPSAANYQTNGFVSIYISKITNSTVTVNNTPLAYALQLEGSLVAGSGAARLTVSSGGVLLRGGADQSVSSGLEFASTVGGSAVEALIGVRGGRTLNINGAITAGAGLTKFGDGMLSINSAAGHALAGDWVIQQGAVRLNADGLSAPPVQVNPAGQLRIGRNATVAAIGGSGGLVIEGGQTLTVDAAVDARFDGPISQQGSGSARLVKQGPGTLSITNPASDFLGQTLIEAGTVRLLAGGGSDFGVLGGSAGQVVLGSASGQTAAGLILAGGHRLQKDITVLPGPLVEHTLAADGAGEAELDGGVALAGALVLGSAGGEALKIGSIDGQGGRLRKTGAGLARLGRIGGQVAQVIVDGGELHIAGGSATVGAMAGGGTVRLESGAALSAQSIREMALRIGQGSLALRPDGGPAGASRVALLEIGRDAGGAYLGRLDLADNDLVVGGGTLAEVRAMIVSGYAGGAWNGPGLAGSAAAGQRRGLGYARGGESLIGLGGVLSGQPYGEQDILVKYTWAGDGDLDGDVDASDVAKWALNFTGELSGAGNKLWTEGDWDYDGDADASDVAKWALNFTGELSGTGLIVDAPGADPLVVGMLQQMGITVVPEPGVVGLALLWVGLGRRMGRGGRAVGRGSGRVRGG